MPILANILIRKTGESVSFLSTDTEVQITTLANIGSGPEEAGTTVAARKLLDILRALPESGDVTMTLLNKRLTVQSGKSRFALQTLAAEEFPTVSVADTYNATVTLPQKTLKHLFNMVHFAMAQQDIRYYLNGLLLVLEGNNVIAVATDGHRLAFSQVTAEQHFERQEVIIPRKTILELQRLLEESDDTVRLDIAASQVKLTFADIELVSKLVEGKFPDYTRVIPKGYKNDFTISREELLRSLQRAATVVPASSGPEPILARVVICTSVSVDRNETLSPFLRMRILARIGMVCRRSTIPLTICSGRRSVSRVDLTSCIDILD
jgi:DNA polymerase-3 subunit beta